MNPLEAIRSAFDNLDILTPQEKKNLHNKESVAMLNGDSQCHEIDKKVTAELRQRPAEVIPMTARRTRIEHHPPSAWSVDIIEDERSVATTVENTSPSPTP